MKLEADGIEFSYGDKKILHSIYISLETGKVTGLLGRNGSGKSTLLQVMYGFITTETQSVRIQGKKLDNVKKIKNIAYLPQYHFVPGNLKLKTILNDFNLELSELEDFSNQKMNLNMGFENLSGGQKRILEIFLILKSDKKFIILDEPFSYLSPILVDKIIKKVQEEKVNKAILITDHLYKHVLDISDELYLIQNGCTRKIKEKEELVQFGYLR